MDLTLILAIVPLLINKIQCISPNLTSTTTEAVPLYCPEFEDIDNAVTTVRSQNSLYAGQVATITCKDGYDLNGPSVIYCIKGEWDQYTRTKCDKRCDPPPYLTNGSLEIIGTKDPHGRYLKGTVAAYSCSRGYYLDPIQSKYRVCQNGIWTGTYVKCESSVKITGCPAPKDLANGYFVHEKTGVFDGYGIGQRLHYSCKSNYVLIGTAVQQCLDDGTWSPKIPPICSLQVIESTDVYPCHLSPDVPHSYTTLIQGDQSGSEAAIPGTVVEIHCLSNFRNAKAPCQPGRLTCIAGQWIGTVPVCVPAFHCGPPPTVAYAIAYSLNSPNEELNVNSRYPIQTKVAYECIQGYALHGTSVLGCSTAGCWMPNKTPMCVKTGPIYVDSSTLSAALISLATGIGVFALLIGFCVISIYRRKKSLARAVAIAPSIQRPDLGDHGLLLHPDRLALIAFADGMQNDRSLPTYDEATRDRGPGLTTNRLHRPHWPNLAGRRTRNTPNPDYVHVTRHGSFASHTPSTRSAGDSMGSTDTMAVSEGSTNVTLDTASSHSGSQAASCRVHCGSLASFDTSSVVNTEGVPLLEENELEEVQGGDNVSLVVENPSISDNASFKLSIASNDLP